MSAPDHSCVLLGVGQEPLTRHLCKDRVDRIINAHFGRIDDQLGMLRHFIGVGHAGEAFEDSCPGLGVQPFPVPLLADLYRSGYVDFNGMRIAVDQSSRQPLWRW